MKTNIIGEAAGLLGVILIAVVAVLVLTSFPAYAGGYGDQITKQAEVLGVDPAAEKLTVRFIEDNNAKGDDLTISIDRGTRVMFCTQPQGLDALKKGDSVTITYIEDRDGFHASDIDFTVQGITAPDANAC